MSSSLILCAGSQSNRERDLWSNKEANRVVTALPTLWSNQALFQLETPESGTKIFSAGSKPGDSPDQSAAVL
jgi:hypothetical protein